MAGGLGFEPRLVDPESTVLPLDDPPAALEFKYRSGSISCQECVLGLRTFFSHNRRDPLQSFTLFMLEIAPLQCLTDRVYSGSLKVDLFFMFGLKALR